MQAATKIEAAVAAEAPKRPMLGVLLASSGLISFSIAVYQFILPLFLYDMTKSSTAMANLRALEYVPNVLLAAVIGVLVDQLNKKHTHQKAIFAQVGILMGLAVLAGSSAAGTVLWPIYAGAFFLMTFGYLNDNIRMVLVKMHIERDQLTTANSRLVSVWTTVGIAAPAVAAAALGFLSYRSMLLILAALLLAAAAINTRLPDDTSPAAATGGFLARLHDGLSVLVANRSLLHLCGIVFLMNAAAGIVDANLVYILKDRVGVADGMVGAVLSCAGIGSFVGSLLAPRLRRRLGLSRIFRISFALNAALYIPALLWPSVATIGAAVFATGCVGMIQSICVWTHRQESTPAAYIGRVGGLTGALFKLGMPVGIVLSGQGVAVFGSSAIFVVAIAINLVLLLAFPFTAVAKVRI